MLKLFLRLFFVGLPFSLSSCLFDTTLEDSSQIQVHYRLELSRDSIAGLDSVTYVARDSEKQILLRGACDQRTIQVADETWLCQFDLLISKGTSVQVEYEAYYQNSKVAEGLTAFKADLENQEKQTQISFIPASSETELSSSDAESSANTELLSSSIRSSSHNQSSSSHLGSSSHLSSVTASCSSIKLSSHAVSSSSIHVSSSSTTVIPVQLVITANGEGSFEGDGAYWSGAWVDIQATPGTGYHFYRWGGQDSSKVEDISSASTRIQMNGSYKLVAIFKKKWTVKIVQQGLGTIVPAANTYEIWDGDQFEVNATPATGYVLDSLRGTQKSDNGKLSWLVTKDDSVHVTFGKIEWIEASRPTASTTKIAWDMAFNSSEASSVGIIVAGYQGSPEIWKSIDKGKTWSSVSVPVIPEPVNFRSVAFESTAGAFYVGGGLKSSGYCTTKILKTVNNGASWVDVGTSGIPENQCVDFLEFTSPTEGYAGTLDGLFYTQDGGTSWSKLFADAVNSMSLGENGDVLVLSGVWEYTQTVYRARRINAGTVKAVEDVSSLSDGSTTILHSTSLGRYALAGSLNQGSLALSNSDALGSGWKVATNGYWTMHYMQQNPTSSDVVMLGFEFGAQSVKVATFALDHQTVTGWRTSFMASRNVLFKGMHEFSDGTIVGLGSAAQVFVRSP